MRNLIPAGFVVLALAFSGCVVRVESEPVHARPGYARTPMTYEEAVAVGTRDCQSRGFSCYLKEAHGGGDGLWKVKFEVARGDARGQLHLEYDGWSRALVRADENVHGHGGHEHEHEHEASAVVH